MVLDEAFKLSARNEVLQRPDIRKTPFLPLAAAKLPGGFGRTGLRLCRAKPYRCRTVHTFPVMQKRKTNSVMFLLPRSTPPFMMRWKISSRAGSCHLLPADFPQRNHGRDFFESRITTKRMPKS